MSLTSYRAAPPRANISGTQGPKQKRRRELGLVGGIFNIMNGLSILQNHTKVLL